MPFLLHLAIASMSQMHIRSKLTCVVIFNSKLISLGLTLEHSMRCHPSWNQSLMHCATQLDGHSIFWQGDPTLSQVGTYTNKSKSLYFLITFSKYWYFIVSTLVQNHLMAAPSRMPIPATRGRLSNHFRSLWHPASVCSHSLLFAIYYWLMGSQCLKQWSLGHFVLEWRVLDQQSQAKMQILTWILLISPLHARPFQFQCAGRSTHKLGNHTFCYGGGTWRWHLTSCLSIPSCITHIASTITSKGSSGLLLHWSGMDNRHAHLWWVWQWSWSRWWR